MYLLRALAIVSAGIAIGFLVVVISSVMGFMDNLPRSETVTEVSQARAINRRCVYDFGGSSTIITNFSKPTDGSKPKPLSYTITCNKS